MAKRYLDEFDDVSLIMELERRFYFRTENKCDYCIKENGSNPVCNQTLRHLKKFKNAKKINKLLDDILKLCKDE